jgi:hypothetical protein
MGQNNLTNRDDDKEEPTPAEREFMENKSRY